MERNLLKELAARCNEDYVSDAGHSIIKCSKCQTELIEIWHTKPYVQMITAITVVCGICGDKSFTKNVSGGFHMGCVENSTVQLVETKPGPITEDGTMLKQELIITTAKA